jgi:hypothetical protein
MSGFELTITINKWDDSEIELEGGCKDLRSVGEAVALCLDGLGIAEGEWSSLNVVVASRSVPKRLVPKLRIVR